MIQSTLQAFTGEIDSAGLFDVIEHIEEFADALFALKARMGRDGRFYAAVPAYNFL